jgi:dCTP deaminase
MFLSDTTIAKMIKDGDIKIKPAFNPEHLRPAGVRVHLGPKVLIPVPGQVVDLLEPAELKYDTHDLRHEPFLLDPGSFILASTIEQIQTEPNTLCLLEGRSTIARLGLSIHNTASVLDGTHNGWLTPVLEMVNHGNFRVMLRLGMPIGMLCFQRLSTRTSGRAKHDQYADQKMTTPANLLRGAGIASFDFPDFAEDEAERLQHLHDVSQFG